MAKKKVAKKAAARKKSKSVAPKKKASKAEAFLQIGKDIWPIERDVLARPDRMKYVRRLIKPDGCVFCHAAKEEISFDTLCVLKTKHSMVMLNKFPYNSGHLLVLPQRHCGDLLKLSDAEYTDLNNTIRVAMTALNDLYQPTGMNIGLNHGATAGAGIPEHLHYHVIPRWSGDLNFFPLIAETKVLVETLEQTYEKVWSNLKKYE